MTYSRITRRDFIKLLCLTPLIIIKQPNSEPLIGSCLGNSNLPNILVLVFDALSARDMSLFGFPRNTTPNIERFAQRATVYHRHYAGGNFTSPGTASLLTGVYPWSHRALHMRGQALERFTDQNLFSLLPEKYHTFAYTHNSFVQILLQQYCRHIKQLFNISYLTLSSNSLADQWLSQDYFIANEAELLLLKNEHDPPASLYASILDRLKRESQTRYLNETFKEQFPRGIPNCQTGKPSIQCFRLEDSIDWLQTQIGALPSPFLGYVHVLPPHAPYNPPSEFVGRFGGGWKPTGKPEHHFTGNNKQKKLDRIRRQYDEFVAYADAQFGRLYDYLDRSGALLNTCLIVTSDHGEMFERGIMGHVTPTLYEPIIHIPLLISRPGQQHRQNIDQPTSAVDLLPTLLHITGQPIPNWCEGGILPGFNDSPSPMDRGIFVVEAKQNPKSGPLRQATFALIKGQHKLIKYSGYPDFDEVYELYNLKQDPEEMNDIYPSSRSITSTLRDELNARLAQTP